MHPLMRSTNNLSGKASTLSARTHTNTHTLRFWWHTGSWETLVGNAMTQIPLHHFNLSFNLIWVTIKNTFNRIERQEKTKLSWLSWETGRYSRYHPPLGFGGYGDIVKAGLKVEMLMTVQECLLHPSIRSSSLLRHALTFYLVTNVFLQLHLAFLINKSKRTVKISLK